MTWSKIERDTINSLTTSVGKIETALVGDLVTKTPGMIDDLRDTMNEVGYIKTRLNKFKKQHLVLFAMASFSLIVVVAIAFGGDAKAIVDWVGNVISGRL